MEKNDVLNVVNAFDGSVQSKRDSNQTINIDEGILVLNLRFYGDIFCISGRLSEDDDTNSSYYHDFELENVDIETWDEIISFINNN
jgi:hypothetical protein